MSPRKKNNTQEEERQTVAPQKVCNACVWHKSKLDNFGKGNTSCEA